MERSSSSLIAPLSSLALTRAPSRSTPLRSAPARLSAIRLSSRACRPASIRAGSRPGAGAMVAIRVSRVAALSSSSGTPRIAQIIRKVRGAAKSAITSTCVCCSIRSSSRFAVSAMNGSSCAIRRGTNAAFTSVRSRVWSGGIGVDQVSVQPGRPRDVAGYPGGVLAQPPVAQQRADIVVAGDLPHGGTPGSAVGVGGRVPAQPREEGVGVPYPDGRQIGGRGRHCGSGHGSSGLEIRGGHRTNESDGRRIRNLSFRTDGSRGSGRGRRPPVRAAAAQAGPRITGPPVTLGYYAHSMPEAGDEGRTAVDGLPGREGDDDAGRNSPDSLRDGSGTSPDIAPHRRWP